MSELFRILCLFILLMNRDTIYDSSIFTTSHSMSIISDSSVCYSSLEDRVNSPCKYNKLELEVGKGALTLEYLMSSQSSEEPFDHKQDRAGKIKETYLRDRQRQKRALTSQILKLQKKASQLDQQLRKAGGKMEHQAGMSDFAAKLEEYTKGTTSWLFQKLVDPNSVGIIIATLGYVETVYCAWGRSDIVVRLVLLYLERVYHQYAPPGKFCEWADYVVKELGAISGSLTVDDRVSPVGELLFNTAKLPVPVDTNPPTMDGQVGISDVADANKAIMNSDALSHLRRVISMLVSIGFVSSKSTMLGMKVFSEKAADKCDSIADIFTIAVSCVDYFVKAGRKYLESSDWMDLAYEDSLQTVSGRMAKILLHKQLLQSEDVDLEEFRQFGLETSAFLKTKAKAENVIGQSAILRHIAVVEEHVNDIKVRQRGFRPKPGPVAININGGSSLGKSSLCHYVSLCAAKALNFESFIGSTAAINGSTKHDDSMNSGVRCILEDDVNYAKQSVVDGVQGTTVMDVVNNNVKFCAKADLDSKGTVVKMCDFYISTCNSETMFIHSFNMPEALFRRVLSLRVKLKPAAQTSSGELDSAFAVRMMAPDAKGVPTRIPSEIWDLSLCKFDFRSNSYQPLYFKENPYKIAQDPLVGGVKLEGVDLPLILVALRHIVQENTAVQKKVVAFLSQPIPSCPHSNFAELCLECNPTLSVVPAPPPNPPPSPQSPPRLRRMPKPPTPQPSPGFIPSYDMMGGPTAAQQAEVCGVEAAAAMNDQAGFESVKKCATVVKDCVHPGRVIRNCSSGIKDIIPQWLAARVVCSTHWLWAPVLRSYFAVNAAERISVYNFRVLYAKVFLSVWLTMSPLLWLLPRCSADMIVLVWSISVVAYFFVCLIKNSIQHTFAAEVVKVRVCDWKKFMENSAECVFSWKYEILGCITAMVLAGLLLKNSFSSKMSQQAYEVPYEAACGWSESKQDVQPSAAVRTSTVDQLVEKLGLHSAVAVATDGEKIYKCRAIPYRNGTWLINKHFVEQVENMPLSWHSAGYSRQLRISRKDWRLVRGDVVLLMVRCPSMPDFSGYITTDIPSGQFPAKWLFKRMDGSCAALDVRAGFVPPSGWAIVPGNKDPLIRVDLGMPSEMGMCGSSLVSVAKGTIAIVGIHRAGFTGTADIACGAFNAFDVKSAYSAFGGVRMTPHSGGLTLMGEPVDLGDNVPLKSCIRHLYNSEGEDLSDRLCVLGSVSIGDKTEKLHGNTKKSPVFSQMCYEFGEPTTAPSKYNQPEWTASQPAVLNTLTPHLYDLTAYECALASTRAFYKRAYDQGVYDGIEPFTMKQAVQGIDGRPYVNSLNFKSSAGLPRNVSKMQFSFEEEETGKRMVTQEIVDEAHRLLALLMVPNADPCIFGEFKVKDEATKLVVGQDGKIRPKNARLYASYPMSFQIVMNMVFGPLAEVECYNPKDLGACVGYDMCSHDAKAVADAATKYSESNIVAGDYVHFDQNSTPEMTDDTMGIDIDIVKGDRVNYPGWAVTVMENIIVMLGYPYMVVNGVLTIIPGMTTSGHRFTLQSNNKNCKFYLAYGFYSNILKQERVEPCENMLEVESCGKVWFVPDFHAVASFVSQGDDHIGSVDPKYARYCTMNTLQSELGEVDIGYTDASKSAVSKDYVEMYSTLGRDLDKLFEQQNAEFLKRNFVKVAMEINGVQFDTVACPIAFRSVTKSLYWKGSYELDHVWLEQVCHGAVREMFFYGEEVFAQFKSKIERVLGCAGMCTFVSPLMSFEQHMQKYVVTLQRCNSVRDVRQETNVPLCECVDMVVRSSLYRIDSPSYIPPPCGR